MMCRSVAKADPAAAAFTGVAFITFAGAGLVAFVEAAPVGDLVRMVTVEIV